MKIVLDPGHGGRDPGAIGRDTGLHEADVNLAVAKLLERKLMKSGHTVALTRWTNDQLVPGDRNRDLAARPTVANKIKADLFLSIHCNSVENRSASGFEAFTTRGQDASDPLATAIINAWMAVFPNALLRADLTDGDPDKEASFAVLRQAKVPAVLVEMEFISNPAGERFLGSAANQERMAEALKIGIEAWGGGIK